MPNRLSPLLPIPGDSWVRKVLPIAGIFSSLLLPAGKGRPRTGLKQWLGRDFSVQVVFYSSFPEQPAALGSTSRRGCDHYEVTSPASSEMERPTVPQPFIPMKY